MLAKLAISVMLLIALAAVACATAPVTTSQAPQQPSAAAQPAPAAPAADPMSPTGSAMTPSGSTSTTTPKDDSMMAMGEPQYGGVINIHVRRDPRGGFDPLIAGGRREARQIIGMPYERIAILDTLPDNLCAEAVRPYLAESWSISDDLKTWDIKLREGVKFHNVAPVNGREMTADDVIFSFERLFDRGIQKTVGENIESMTAPDKYTVRITTVDPSPQLPLQLLTWRSAMVMAKEAAGPEGNFDTRETAIGTGPFILTEYTPGVGHVVVRNPDYWAEGLPYADGVKLSIMRDVSTRIAALQVGKLDFLEEVTISAKQRLERLAPNIKYTPCETPSYNLWMDNDIPPFDDVRVRRAFSMAMDRPNIIKGPFRGEGLALGVGSSTWEHYLAPNQHPPEQANYLEHNPQAAKALLSEAGYPNGLDVTLFVGLHHGSPFRELVESLPALFAPAGIKVTLDPQELAAYQEGISTRGYGAAGVMKSGYGSPYINMIGALHCGATPSVNRSGICEPGLDAQVERARATGDDQERADLFKQLQTRIVDQAYWVAFPGFYRFNAFSERLNGTLKGSGPMFRHQTGVFFRELWLTQ